MRSTAPQCSFQNSSSAPGSSKCFLSFGFFFSSSLMQSSHFLSQRFSAPVYFKESAGASERGGAGFG